MMPSGRGRCTTPATAVAHLSVQAQFEGLAVHQLGGCDTAALSPLLPTAVVPLVVLAIGRRDDQAELPEPFAGREAAARDRLPVDALQIPVDVPLTPAIAA